MNDSRWNSHGEQLRADLIEFKNRWETIEAVAVSLGHRITQQWARQQTEELEAMLRERPLVDLRD
jgi:hypothetical protein